jgi:hypothetical protein
MNKITLLESKMDFLSANSRIEVQNDGMYLPLITWGCTSFFTFHIYNDQCYDLVMPFERIFRKEKRKIFDLSFDQKCFSFSIAFFELCPEKTNRVAALYVL